LQVSTSQDLFYLEYIYIIEISDWLKNMITDPPVSITVPKNGRTGTANIPESII
jgi:hypothetical protein